MSKVIDGSNGGPTESIFFRHQRAFDDVGKQRSALMAAEKKAKKAAEDDGIPWDDLKAVNKLRAKGTAGATEEAARLNRMRFYLTCMKHPLAPYLVEVNENIADETGLTDEQREEKWKGIGEVAGKEGKGLDAILEGHDPNSETGRWITAGWEAGQAFLGAKIKPLSAKDKKAAEKEAAEKAKAAEAEAAANTAAQANGSGRPAGEPEVVAANARGKARRGGLTYWHNPELKKVYEVSIADADPVGAVSVTKAEHDKLKAEYAKAEAEAWDESGPAPGAAAGDDGFDGSPPDPDAAA